MMNQQDAAVLTSLVLTIPTILLAMFVAWTYGSQTIQWLKHPREKFDRVQWLIVGITLGFLGQVFDNLFWQVAWTADFLRLSQRDEIFSWGAAFNIVSRQGFGIAAAMCHIRSAYLATGRDDDFDTKRDKLIYWLVLFGSLSIGVTYGLTMYFLKF